MRLKLLGASAAVVAAGLAFEVWVSPRLAWVASLPTCESLPWVRLELIVGVLVCWYIGYVALKQGLQTWKHEQTPLPDTWVWSRTQVRTGSYAKFVAVVALSTSASFLLGPMVVVIWHELYVVFCFPQVCKCA
jgi:hypothetical protein